MRQKIMQPQNRRVVAALLFSILWTVIQYNSGNGLEGIYLVLFVLAMVFFRPAAHLLLAIFIGMVLLFQSPNLDTLFQLKNNYLKVANNPALAVNEIVRPGSGLQVLPEQVLQMLKLIKKYDLQDYKVSTAIRRNSLVYQRIIESAWPVRLALNSHYQFRLNTEAPAGEQCKVLGRQKDVSLDYCR